MEWLAFSIVASVVLTVLLNVGLRLFPSAGRGLSQWLAERAAPGPGPSDGEPERRVRVIAPWRAMLVASLVLTVVLNLVLALAR